MKTEIVNFINDLPPEVHSFNLSLEEGLYLMIDLDETGNLTNTQKEVFGKNSEITPFFQDCLNIQTNLKPVAATKIFNPNKKIFNASCSPFAICFKKKFLDKNIKAGTDVKKEMEQYFHAASKYTSHEEHNKWFNQFRKYCLENLLENVKNLEEYKVAKPDFAVNVYLKRPSLQDYQITYESYVINNVFNKDEYKIESNGITYNIADSLSSFSEKKMFWKHKTAPFEFNLRIIPEEAKATWQFFELRKRLLPNPLPIFIDKPELNNRVITLVKEDSRIKYSEILKKLFEEHKKDIGNYYLLFFQKGELVDLDFVPSFQYEIKSMVISEVFPLGSKQQRTIENIFQFEREVANKFFNGQLVTETKAGGLWLRYFGDVEYNPKYLTQNTYNQLLKYRKGFYDFIYKSKRQAIQQFMLQDIMIHGILDDLRHHQTEKTAQYSTSEYAIKEKLNIWFSLYNYFDSNNSKSINIMINKTELLRKRIGDIAKNEGSEPFIANEDEFAFASGQVINWLLLQSESSNRTHALLEPFLQKIDAKLFREAMGRTFEMYKHKFTLYPNKYEFDRVFGQVMGCDTNVSIKSLLPLILAGYFSESVFKKINSKS